MYLILYKKGSTHLSLYAHVVFGTKYGRPMLSDEVCAALHPYLGGVLRLHGAQPVGIDGVEDHVHLLFGFRADQRVCDLVREVKRGSSHWLKANFGVRTFGWQDGYAAFSVSARALPIVRAYITRQRQHHARRTLDTELAEMVLQADGASRAAG